MTGSRVSGRLVGALLLLQIVAGVLVNFVLTAPLFQPPGFLVAAAAHSDRIALSVGVGILLGLLTAWIAVGTSMAARERAGTLALLLLVVAGVSFAATVVEQTAVQAMLNLSQAHAAAPAAEQGVFQGPRLMTVAARNAAHYVSLLVGGLMLLMFHATLLRARLVPRVLAVFGLLASLLQVAAVSIALSGRPMVFPLLAPLALCQLVLAGWLLVRGWAEPGPRPALSGRAAAPAP
jgi:hypothetical protein